MAARNLFCVFSPPKTKEPATGRQYGSTPALTPSGARRQLEWWSGCAEVMRRKPNCLEELTEKMEVLEFAAAHAADANEAMRTLVDTVFLPLLVGSPVPLSNYLKYGKKTGRKKLSAQGGFDDASANGYERLMATVHILNLLDIWRRNTQHFLHKFTVGVFD